MFLKNSPSVSAIQYFFEVVEFAYIDAEMNQTVGKTRQLQHGEANLSTIHDL